MSVCSVEQLDVLLLHVVHTCTCALYWHVDASCILLQKLRMVKSETSQNASSRINPERSCVKCVFLAWRSQIQLGCFFSCIPPPPPSPRPHPLQAGFPGLCQHAERGGLHRWTRRPAAPHPGVGGAAEKRPPAADGQRPAARESVRSPARACPPPPTPPPPAWFTCAMTFDLTFCFPPAALMNGEPRPRWIWP